MNPTMGFFMYAFAHAHAASSAVPPISPMSTTASVSGSSLNSLSASVWFVPMIGSPPIPMQLDCPSPIAES